MGKGGDPRTSNPTGGKLKIGKIGNLNLSPRYPCLRTIESVYPWAKAEWTGPWSRTSRMWNKSQDIREREKYYPKSTCERGEFWMAWSDWSERFDILNICYIPDERKGINYRIIGDFNPKLNSPLDLPDMKKYYLRSGS